jgi:hypothetical protein
MQLTSLHPALTAVEAAMAEYSKRRYELPRREEITRLLKEVDPSGWTECIEASLGSKEKLQKLSVVYDEEAIWAFSNWLRSMVAHERFENARRELEEEMRKLLALHDSIRGGGPESWLKLLIKNRFVQAVDACNLREQDCSEGRFDGDYDRLCQIFISAFKALAANLSALPPKIYPTDFVRDGRLFEMSGHNRDLRCVFPIYSGYEADAHPANSDLAELLRQVNQCCEAGTLAANRLKGTYRKDDHRFHDINNGTINEKQHANRLVDFLHNQGENIVAQSLSAQIAEQEERRRLYENVRWEVWLAERDLSALKEKLLAGLRAAVCEIEQLLAARPVKASEYSVRLMVCINNCLAADLSLRRIGLETPALIALYKNDLSHGAGQSAVTKSFEAKRQLYKPLQAGLDYEP